MLEAVQHPNADRLRVCTVDVGDGEPVTIVCGAPNVAAGQTVAVARPGAQMADGRTLGAAKLRGIVSDGMILATDEIALGGDHAGILVLDDGPAPGTPLDDVLPLGTDVLELEVTPNRADCLAVYGVAREVHAVTGAPLAAPPWAEDPGSLGRASGRRARSRSSAPTCARASPRASSRTSRSAPRRCGSRRGCSRPGMRPISNVVDITNYVMLLTGQPLHAFDLDRVAGAQLTVRRARGGRDASRRSTARRDTLAEGMVVICDADGPDLARRDHGRRALRGRRRARRACCSRPRRWDGATVQRTARRARAGAARPRRASRRASRGARRSRGRPSRARCFIELCGAAPAARHDRRRRARARAAADHPAPGAPRDAARRRDRRRSAAARSSPRSASRSTSGLRATVPHFRRGDVTREIDLIEEVARIDGLDRLPATLPPRSGVAGRLTHAQRVRRRAEDALAARGLCEIAGWTFADPALLDRLRLPAEHPMRRTLSLANPLSESLSMLRPTLLGSLLDAAAHNAARGASELALFESGTVFRAREGRSPTSTTASRCSLERAATSSPANGDCSRRDCSAACSACSAVGRSAPERRRSCTPAAPPR